MMNTGTRAARAAALALTGLICGGAALADTAYGCRDLVKSGLLAAVEGNDGYFFRLDPDLYSDHSLEPPVIAQIAALAKALASRGTTLIYVPVPTKALTLPGKLPPEAGNLGYDPDIAATLYDQMVKDLGAAGVLAVDARHALRRTRGGSGPVFRTDPRLTAAGAEALASATVAVISELPGYARLPKAVFRSRREGTDILPSHIRLMLQEHCTARLPLVEAERHVTSAIATATTVSAETDPMDDNPSVVVVSTDIAGVPASNFAGFLSAYSKLETRQVTAPDDDAFTAISSYLTSDEFAAAPPAVLVWTNPVWNNLANHGDQPMRELIAAAGTTCNMPLALTVDRDGIGHADLSGIGADSRLTLKLDTGSVPGAVIFAFNGPQDRTRLRSVHRLPDQNTHGRFYMPLTALWPEGVDSLSITLADAGFGPAPTLTLCNGEG